MAELSTPFKITCAIENTACYERIEKGLRKRFVVGKASGTQIDREHERVAETALVSIQKAIEEGIVGDDGSLTRVPLMSEHEKAWDDELGVLTKAWLDENFDLWVEAELDEDNPRSHYLYTRLNKGKQYGLSIGGRVLEAGYEWSDELSKSIRVFYDVGLREVSVVSKPAYPTAYLKEMNKSVSWDGVQGERQAVVSDEIMKSYRKKEHIDMEEQTNIEKSEEVVETAEPIVEKAADAEQVEEPTVEKGETETDPTADVEKAAEETVEGEDVEKAEAYVSFSANAYGDAKEDPLGVLQAAIESLTNEIESIKGVLKSVNEAPTGAEVEKSEGAETGEEEAVEKTAGSDESTDTIEKSGTEDQEDVIAKALNDSLAAMLDEKLAPVTAILGGLEKRMTEVENAEVDGSISVSKAIGNAPEDEADPYTELEKNLNELPTSADRIAYLLRIQQQG